MTDYVIDIETDGIDATKIHCMSIHDGDKINTLVTYADMQVFIANLDSNDRIIGHNFIRYDAPIIERILDTKLPCEIVDTLALSWYLYPNRTWSHGLEKWGEDLGIAKPKIEDWENLTIEEYTHRCEQDVRINTKLWLGFNSYLEQLYDGKTERILKYLSLKMRCAMLQERSKWKLDVDKAQALLEELTTEYDKSYDRLFKVMPQVPKYTDRKPPSIMYKKDGSLSAAGERWCALCDEHGYDRTTHRETIKQLVKWADPNPTSMVQIKAWLFELGWVPDAYELNPNKTRVPLVKHKDGTLCVSVEAMISKHPYLEELATMTVVKSRISVVNNLLKAADDKGFVAAQVHGFTNTLRFRHSVCVNIPSPRKPYGKEIRALFTVRKPDHVLCGSDMASLEDRTKQHYMWSYDPDYVKEMMTEDFDPHLDLALSAGAVTPEQVAEYKAGNHTPEITQVRHNYKGGNYACTYGAGVLTLSRQLGISESEAGKIHRAYWKRNWAVKSIADDVTLKSVKNVKKEDNSWLYNPVSKLYYFLKADKDRFSTLNQGTGVFCFDVWIAGILRKRPQLTAQFHDEIILECKQGTEQEVINLLKESVHDVNKKLKLNRELDCDIQFGKDYSNIH
jgi:hypothetical protein